MGLARGIFEEGRLRIERATLGSAGESAVATVAGWIASADRYVLAFDAPLGWPAALGEALSEHQAGGPLGGQSAALFGRRTDRFVAERMGRTPPEVGADRVARVAYAALKTLNNLRKFSGLQVPLAWEQDRDSGAIEVYPPATLRAHGLSVDAHRGKTAKARAFRNQIIDHIESQAELWVSRELLVEDAHLLDAVVCTLAAADFVKACCYRPTEEELAHKEGWIWVRDEGQRSLF